MKHEPDTRRIRLLKEAVEESAKEPIFPLRTVRQVAKIFNVSPSTVKSWRRSGLLRGHYQILSGRSCRLVFPNAELEKFFQENFPTMEDLSDHPSNSRRESKAVKMIERMLRLYARRCR